MSHEQRKQNKTFNLFLPITIAIKFVSLQSYSLYRRRISYCPLMAILLIRGFIDFNFPQASIEQRLEHGIYQQYKCERL